MCCRCKVIRKMYCLLVALVLGLEKVSTTPVPTNEIPPEDNIKINLIGYENDLIEGLTPPVPEALNHYNLESPRSAPENPYVVEISRSHLKIRTTGFPAQTIKLSQAETEGIQNLSLSIVQVLNSSKLAAQAPGGDVVAPDSGELNPVIVLTNSGISLRFLNASETDVQATEETSPEHKRILWDFLTKYARNIFEEKMRELKLTNKFAEAVDSPADQSDSPFETFANLLWRIVTFSVHYAETAFEGWTTPRAETAKPEPEKKAGSTAATLFAFEEPSPFHEFPSQEFQFRRKDIDSIFYGRGVI